MARRLLDTDAVIDHLEGIPSSVAFITGLDETGDLLCTCDIVLAEVYSGLSVRARDAAREFLDSLYFFATTPKAARLAGEWRYTYARRGIRLSVPDMVVAAVAHTYQAEIVTANLKDYPMPEVTVLPLPRASR